MVTDIVPKSLTSSVTALGVVPSISARLNAAILCALPSSVVNEPDTLPVPFLAFTLPSFSSMMPKTSPPSYATPCSVTALGAT